MDQIQRWLKVTSINFTGGHKQFTSTFDQSWVEASFIEVFRKGYFELEIGDFEFRLLAKRSILILQKRFTNFAKYLLVN